MSAPAIAHGNARNCVVAFIEESNGDLVDINHYCDDCGIDAWLPECANAMYWPAFFSDAQQSVYCANCGQIIHEVEEN